MKLNTIQHPKILRLRRRLSVPTWGAVGVLESLWHLTATHAKDGAIGRIFTNEDIANSIGWEGEPDHLIDALVASGWLDTCAINRLIVHDWSDHCPDFVRGNLARQKVDFAVATTNSAAPTPVAYSSTVLQYATPVPYSSTVHESPTPRPRPKPIPIPSQDPEEKVSVELPEAVNPPPDAVAEFPCQGLRQVWHLTTGQVADWQTSYPGLDVEAECRKALAWLKANPRKKRTHGGMPKFLVNWFNRATDRPGPAPPRAFYQPRSATPSPTVTERMGADVVGMLFGQHQAATQPMIPTLELEVRHG